METKLSGKMGTLWNTPNGKTVTERRTNHMFTWKSMGKMNGRRTVIKEKLELMLVEKIGL